MVRTGDKQGGGPSAIVIIVFYIMPNSWFQISRGRAKSRFTFASNVFRRPKRVRSPEVWGLPSARIIARGLLILEFPPAPKCCEQVKEMIYSMDWNYGWDLHCAQNFGNSWATEWFFISGISILVRISRKLQQRGCTNMYKSSQAMMWSDDGWP